MKRVPEGDRWRLQAITISHFRGVADAQTIRFDGLSGLLHGNNGVGKSTVAQCLQWTLYGRFPENVLANASYPRFLTPVAGRKRAYSGEVTFQRGTERLVLRREEAKDSFMLTLGSHPYRGEEATTRRDELLGLDMETFVRAVLLQQSRVRGLLLDDPKDRNKALDRLLGMDALEHLLAVIDWKRFGDAARAWRDRIEVEENEFAATEKLLKQQRETAESDARDSGFIAKDFNRTGLQKAYTAVDASLNAAAKRYNVEINRLPPCDAPGKAASTHRGVTKLIREIRVRSKHTKQIEPIRARSSKLATLQDRWKEVTGEREQETALIRAWVEKNGDKEAVTAAKSRMRKEIAATKKDLGAANALYQLLCDARAYAEHHDLESCPVCDQALPRGMMKLASALEKRTRAMTSKLLDELSVALETKEQKLAALDAEMQQLEEREGSLAQAQRRVDGVRREAEKTLECGELPEAKIAKRIGEELVKLSKQEHAIEEGIAAMEEDLAIIQEQSQRIQAGLVPVLQKREEQRKHEDAWEARKAAHAKENSRAEEMDRRAHDLERIRAALLQAKNEIASKSLERARPRAADLYSKLVRHPQFDTLQLATQRKKNKVDYSFEVSIRGASSAALEARLALSDGQLTTAALGVFFALAESTAHGLDLLYVDDPTQNLDQPCKEAMAKLIADIAKRKQVIVSTHDVDFVHLLDDEGFHDRAFIHHLKQWDGNPTYETMEPSSGAVP